MPTSTRQEGAQPAVHSARRHGESEIGHQGRVTRIFTLDGDHLRHDVDVG
jgi:hypothetical protein